MADFPLQTVAGLLQGVFLLFIAPGLIGLLRYFKAGLQQRQRRFLVAISQPYRHLAKLMRKPVVRAQTTSWVFAATPVVLFTTYGLLAFLVPVFHQSTLITADLILIVYLLGLARFSVSLAGLDAGTPFGGLGSSREMFLHFLTEIGLFLVIAALAIRWGSIRLDVLFVQHGELGLRRLLNSPELLLLALALFVLILFESGRIPINNPTTHLELTMGQKAITLEYAGHDLALIEWSEMIKLTFLLTLWNNLFIPYPILPDNLNSIAIVWALAGYTVKMLFITFALALWEVSRPKLRIRAVIRPGLYPIVFSLLAMVYYAVTAAFKGGQ